MRRVGAGGHTRVERGDDGAAVYVHHGFIVRS